MKLLDIIFGEKKKAKKSVQHALCTVARKPAEAKPRLDKHFEDLPKKQPAATNAKGQPRVDPVTAEPVFRGPICADDEHDFVHPYPHKCRKCGLPLQWNEDNISQYMGSYIDGTAYQWTRSMDRSSSVSFSLSSGDRPVFSANCDFSSLKIRNALNGSRDGWMQPQYPSNYFEPRNIPLSGTDIGRLKDFFNNCDFSAWETPVHYVENHDAPGFSVKQRFTCTFPDGRKFTCLDPDNAEFEQLVTMLKEMAGRNARAEDQAFVQAMLKETEKKQKHIYWLISCSRSMEENHAELLRQGVPFFHYMITRAMRQSQNTNKELLVNVIQFADGAVWSTKEPVPESEYQWEYLPAGNRNDLGAAISLLTQRFETLPEPKREMFPIVALVLDGPVTDDWKKAIKQFRSLPGVEKHVLIVVLALSDQVDKKQLEKQGCIVYDINSLDDIMNELDSPLFGY